MYNICFRNLYYEDPPPPLPIEKIIVTRGSFNPAHPNHLLNLEAASCLINADHVAFSAAGEKVNTSSVQPPQLASSSLRLEFAKTLADSLELFRKTPLQLLDPKTTETYAGYLATLKALAGSENPELHVVMGTDVAEIVLTKKDLPESYYGRPEDFTLHIFDRPDSPIDPAHKNVLTEAAKKKNAKIQFHSAPEGSLVLSSFKVREWLETKNWRELLKIYPQTALDFLTKYKEEFIKC